MAQKVRDHEVLISGAGPAGLGAALFFRRAGADVELIDKRWQGPARNPAVLLHPDTLALLDDVGVRFDLTRDVQPIDSLAFYEGSARRGRVEFEADAKSLGFAAVVPMSVLRERLEQRLDDMGIEVHWNHRLASIEAEGERIRTEVDVLGTESLGYGVLHAEAYVKHRLYQAPHVLIGADGPESVVRQQLHFAWDSVGEAKVMLAFAVDTSLHLGGEMRVTRSERGVLSSVWPLPGVQAVRVNMALPMTDPLSAKAERGEKPTEHELLELVRVHLPWFEESATNARLVVFEVFTPTLASETQAHTYLLGESSHRLLHFVSHSLNLSLRRAHELSTMVRKERLGQIGAPSFAESGRAWRSAAERIATASSEGLAPAATAFSPAQDYAWVLPLIPAAGDQLLDIASKLHTAQA